MNAADLSFPGAAGADASANAYSACEARLSLGFTDDNGVTRLTDRRHFGPLRVQKALYPEAPSVCHAIVIHPPGGVVGGDRLQIDVDVGANAGVLMTTPGAAKWYKSNGHVSRQQIRLEVAAGAALEWLPQETIFFNHAHVMLDHHVALAADARYIGGEILCFGRTASGERFDHGRIGQHTSIRRGGKLLWWEQGTLDGDSAGMHSLATLGGYTVSATLLAVGKTMPAGFIGSLRDVANASLSAGQAIAGDTAAVTAATAAKTGVTQMKSLLVARYLGHSSESARAWMSACWQHLRPELLGRAAVVPRIWHT